MLAKYLTNDANIRNVAYKRFLSSFFRFIDEFIYQCLQVSLIDRPAFNKIFVILRSYNEYNKTNSTEPCTEETGNPLFKKKKNPREICGFSIN